MNRHTIFRHTRTGESMRTPIVDDDNPSSGSIISYNNQWTDGVLVTAHSSWYGWGAGSILSTLDECEPLITGYKSCVYIYIRDIYIYIYVHIHIVEYNDGIYIHYITSHHTIVHCITLHHFTLLYIKLHTLHIIYTPRENDEYSNPGTHRILSHS